MIRQSWILRLSLTLITSLIVLTGCSQAPVSIPTPTFSSDAPQIETAPQLSGQVVYQSSVGGSLQIFVVDLSSGDIKQLTNEGENIEPSWSPDGSHIAYGCDMGQKFELCLMDADGSNQRQITTNTYNDWAPAWSPDGSQLVYVSSEIPFAHLMIMDLSTGQSRRLLSQEGNEGSPDWSSDGERIIYMSDRGNYFNLYTVHPDGTNEIQLTSFGQDDRPSWSSDGKNIVFRRQTVEASVFSGAEIFVAAADGSNDRQLTNDNLLQDWPTFSPDGKWILISADLGSGSELIILPINGGPPAHLTENGVFGSAPDWRQ